MSESTEQERENIAKVYAERCFRLEFALREIANVKTTSSMETDFWRLLQVVDIAKKALEVQ